MHHYDPGIGESYREDVGGNQSARSTRGYVDPGNWTARFQEAYQNPSGLDAKPWQQETKDNVTYRREFEGKDEEWYDFRVFFERMAALNGWNEETQLLRLLCSLRGGAEQYANGLPKSDKENIVSLMAALEVRFGPYEERDTYLAEAKQRRKKTGESYREFAQGIEILLRKALPGQEIAIQLIGRTIFTDNCDPKVRKTIRQAKAKTIREAVEAAVFDEKVIYGLEKQMGNVKNVKDKPKGPKQDKQTSSASASAGGKRAPPGNCPHCGEFHWANECPSKQRVESQAEEPLGPPGLHFFNGITCYRCHTEGHYAAECPYSGESGGGQGGRDRGRGGRGSRGGRGGSRRGGRGGASLGSNIDSTAGDNPDRSQSNTGGSRDERQTLNE